MNKIRITALIVILCLVILVGGALAGGLYYMLETNDINDTKKNLIPFEVNFGKQTLYAINLYASTLDTTEQINAQSNIITLPLGKSFIFRRLKITNILF